jgi:hypothetical protein
MHPQVCKGGTRGHPNKLDNSASRLEVVCPGGMALIPKCWMLRRRDVIAAYNHEVLKRGISEKEENFRVLCSTS